MSNLTATATWSDVYQLETSDPVLGGPGAMDNRQAQSLINRTEFLKNASGIHSRYGEVVVINANTTLDASHVGKLIQVIATDNITLTIDQQRNFPAHSVLHIRVICIPNKCITIQPSAGEQIDFGSDQENELHLIDGEYLNLVTNSNLSGSIETGRFIVDGCSDSLFTVGEEVKAKAILKNTYKLSGLEVSRADFARIWKWIQRNIVDGQGLVDDATWLGSQNIVVDGETVTVYPYKGCFSKGNGTTTFRFSDDRGMFERNFDDGRGIDNDSLWNYPGGYEHDRVKKHGHGINTTSSGASNNDGADPVRGSIAGSKNTRGNRGNGKTIEETGGAENLVKNITKISLIRL